MCKSEPSRYGREIAVSIAIFAIAFAWYWFWRPYGLWYGGDSEYLDRQVNGGLWFRKRELLAVAGMQLCRQIVTLQWGWPVSWAISLASCLAGAAATVVLWRLFRNTEQPLLSFALVLCSGHVLLYHGSIESYALPTCLMAVWILALHRVHEGRCPTWTIAFAFAGMMWCHVMALFLFPSLLLSLWLYRDRPHQREWAYWVLALVVAGWVYVVTNVLNIGEGLGFEGTLRLFADSGEKEFGPFFSIKHLKIKVFFLWVGTHITLLFALAAFWKNRKDPEVLQIAAMALCALGFLVVFHPDTGYRDWDLFVFPSLPVAVLGVRYVVRSPHKTVLAMVWLLAFLAVWAPRVPFWAKLSERGLAEVVITNYPTDRTVKLDNRYRIPASEFRTQGGEHTLSVMKRGELTTKTTFKTSPGERIELEVPIESVPVPFADRIKMLEEEVE